MINGFLVHSHFLLKLYFGLCPPPPPPEKMRLHLPEAPQIDCECLNISESRTFTRETFQGDLGSE